MECHEALMARRRKKTSRNATQRQKSASNHLDKSLPQLPPSEAHKHAFTPSVDSPPPYSSNLEEAPSLAKQVEEMRKASERRENSPSGLNNRGEHHEYVSIDKADQW